MNDRIKWESDFPELAQEGYANWVARQIRSKYSQYDIEAILLNVDEHPEELAELQSYRKNIKDRAKELFPYR